jgi:heptosyltransferase-2
MIRNILVVSVNWLGDAVFSTPVFHALKEHYAPCRVSALCVPRVKDVLAMCPDIDEIIVYDEEGADRSCFRKMKLAAQLGRMKFDAVFLLRRSLSRTLLCCFAGIPERIGFASGAWSRLLTHVVSDQGNDDLHRSDVYLKVVESFGVRVRDRRCSLRPAQAEVDKWRSYLSAAGVKPGEKVIAVNTGGNWLLKQWPPEKFAAFIGEIYKNNMGRVILPGAERDFARVRRIADLSGVGPLAVAGETGLKGLAGLLSCADLLVTADTGPLHLASALGVPVVAIFGPTRPEITGPRGKGPARIVFKEMTCNRAPCYYLECPDNRCMKSVEVEDVIKAVQAIQG